MVKYNFFDRILKDSKILVIVWADDGTIQYANKNVAKKTGYKTNEFIGKNWAHVFANMDDLQKIKQNVVCIKNKSAHTGYYQSIRCKDDRVLDVIWKSMIFDCMKPTKAILSIGMIMNKENVNCERPTPCSHYSSIIKLPDHSSFTNEVNQAINKSDNYKKPAAMLLIDVDNYIDLSNAYGYKFGDNLLKNVEEIFSLCFHRNEILSHYEEDCFAIFIPDIKDIKNAIDIAKRTIRMFHMPWGFGKRECYTTVSIGISMYPNDGSNAEILINNAKAALSFAKKNGKDRYKLYSKAIDIHISKRLNIEYNLRKAIQNEEFAVYYQPQVDISTGNIVSLEALVRWIHPIDGVIPPSAFIPVAEETGLINPISEWVLKTACKQIQKLNSIMQSNMILAVNLSASQLQSRNLSNRIFEIIQHTQFDPELLEIEITEEAAIKDINATIRLLRELGEKNIKIALDDFCTGYSSLHYLERLPVNKIKIDKSFIQGITESYKKELIVESLINLAHQLDILIVAEGVEEQLQYESLKEKNCNIIQGYYFSKPLPFEELTQYITQKAQC